jgi:CRISPR-associated protein (TIGR03984 family)
MNLSMDNKLKITTIKSSSEPLTGDWSEQLPHFNGATVACWLFDDLVFGVVKNNVLEMFHGKVIADEDIIELRIFNENTELYVRKTKDGLKSRIRKDAEGTDTEVVDADMVTWGTDGEVKGGFTHLWEDRGTQITIPGDFSSVSPSKRVRIQIRNYIGYNTEIGQATYVDARFVKFLKD